MIRKSGYSRAVGVFALLIALAGMVLSPSAATTPPAASHSALRPAYALPERAVVLPVMDCAAIAAKDFTGIEGAATTIASAKVEPASEARAEFCVIKGMISPQIQFEVRLPTKTYTGRYLQAGCGGACGLIMDEIIPHCDEALAYGGAFALAFENSGHVGSSMIDTIWALDAPALRKDFAERAAHVTSVVVKRLITDYYGQPPVYSYFQGCSNGGREGLKEAQVYPDDFDGIVAAAPAYWISLMPLRTIWESQHGLDEQGNQILTQAAVATLHRAVMDECDPLDGLKDGQIDDPRACHYDPGKLVCKPGQADNCITERQARVARAFYSGPLDEKGRHLYLGGEPYGSELTWTEAFSSMGGTLGAQQIKFMIYDGKPPKGFDWRTWKPGKAELADLFKRGGFYHAANPDLRRFKQSGGKLILWQGAADNAAGQHGMFEYYQKVRDKMGGFTGTDPFMRVFLVPGMYHCRGGYMPYQMSYLSAMVDWVEKGTAPESVMSAATLADGTTRTRPLYPYPQRAKYKGSGDINRAENFGPEVPASPPDDHYDWLGSNMN